MFCAFNARTGVGSVHRPKAPLVRGAFSAVSCWRKLTVAESPGVLMKNKSFVILLFSFILGTSAQAQQSLDAMVDRELAALVSTYKMLHAAPELSHYEVKTSAFFAAQLRALGYTVTENVGKYAQPNWKGHGVVAMMKNGDGPTVLVRNDLEALPVEEKTGLTYASPVKTQNDAGQDVSVMQACGHDIHITNMLGTARMLAQ